MDYFVMLLAMLPQLVLQVIVIATGVWLGLTVYHRGRWTNSQAPIPNSQRDHLGSWRLGVGS
jgi:hypothetical protein